MYYSTILLVLYLLVFEIQPPSSENRIRLTEARATDENNNTNKTIQMFSEVSRWYCSGRKKSQSFLIWRQKVNFFILSDHLSLCAFRPFINLSNRDTTMHYGLIFDIFCAFSWPNTSSELPRASKGRKTGRKLGARKMRKRSRRGQGREKRKAKPWKSSLQNVFLDHLLYWPLIGLIFNLI